MGVNAADMLVQLDIRNVALIDEISMELGEGLNVPHGGNGSRQNR